MPPTYDSHHESRGYLRKSIIINRLSRDISLLVEKKKITIYRLEMLLIDVITSKSTLPLREAYPLSPH